MGAITTAVTLALQGGSMIAQSRAQARSARANRQFAQMAEQDVMTRGNEEVLAYQRELSQVTGQQRVGLAAQNIDLTQGTAAEIARQTQQIGQQDIATIRRNIEREAWGIRTQANINYRAGMAQSQASALGAAGTLLSAAGSGWSSYQGSRSPANTIPAGRTIMRSPLMMPAGAS